MIIELTLQNIMVFMVCALAIIGGVLLLLILWDIRKVTNILRPLVERNQGLFEKNIRTIPLILENVEQISSNVKETTDKLKVTVPVILQEVEVMTIAAKGSIELAGVVMENMGSGINETVATYKKDTSSFMSYLHIIEEILLMIYSASSSRR